MEVFKFMRTGLFAVVISLMLLQACDARRDYESAEEGADSDIIKKEVILSPGTQDLLNRFPTPFELTKMLEESGATYIFSLTNPPANVDKYFTQKTKALNLGVYSTDLAYSSTFQRTSETEKFMYCTGKLAGDLGIAGVYDKNLAKKINFNQATRDSLVALVKRFFGETNNFLRRNNRNQVAILVAAGSFAEGLYIASSLCQFSPENQLIAQAIVKQQRLLDKLLVILGEYGLDSTIKPVADELAKLRPVFSDFGLGSGKPVPVQKAAEMVRITGEVRSFMIK